MPLDLPSSLLLLSLDDEKGKPLVDSTRLDSGLASCALLELMASGSLAVDDDGLVSRTSTPDDDLLAEIANTADGQSISDAVMKIAGVSGWKNSSQNLRNALLERMVDSGELSERRSKVLGVFTRTSFPQADGAAESALRHDVDQVLLHDEECSTYLAGLIGVAQACGLIEKLYDQKSAIERAEAIAAGHHHAIAVTESFDALMTGIMTTVIASTVAYRY